MLTPKIAAVTFASNTDEPGLHRLARTLSGWGWEFRPVVGVWRGFASKMRGVLSAIPQLRDEGFTHLLFTDAYDTLCVGPPSAVLPYCTDKMLVSCEVAPWPGGHPVDRYQHDPGESRWRYVNSGGYLGPLDLLQEVLEGVEGDDQLWLANKYVENQQRIVRDHRCEVFQTLGHTVLPWAPWDKTFEFINRQVPHNGRVWNKETSTCPVFIHGNGRALEDPKVLMGGKPLLVWLDERLRVGEDYDWSKTEQGVAPVVVPAPKQEAKMEQDPATFDCNTIHGFGDKHDFAPFYERLVEECPSGGTIVEVGCYHGRSLVHLAQTARRANKGIKVVGVEHGVGQGEGCVPIILDNLAKAGMCWHLCSASFDKVMGTAEASWVDENGPVARNREGKFDVFVYQLPSVDAVRMFADDSVWCVFLDDGHLHEEVASGIDAWMPKVRADGLLAGHDSKWFSVWEPCKAKLPGVIHDPSWPDCWFCKKCVPLVDVDIHAPVRIEFEHGDRVFGYGQGLTRSDGRASGSPLLA